MAAETFTSFSVTKSMSLFTFHAGASYPTHPRYLEWKEYTLYSPCYLLSGSISTTKLNLELK